jgi:hypothetical protein
MDADDLLVLIMCILSPIAVFYGVQNILNHKISYGLYGIFLGSSGIFLTACFIKFRGKGD